MYKAFVMVQAIFGLLTCPTILSYPLFAAMSASLLPVIVLALRTTMALPQVPIL